MAKNGFKVFDSDMHIMEPPDLWQRYIAPEFRAQAPARQNFRECPRSWHDLSERFPAALAPAAPRISGHNYDQEPRASTAITRSAAGPAKCNSRRWTPKALTLPCCFPRAVWACSPIPIRTPFRRSDGARLQRLAP